MNVDDTLKFDYNIDEDDIIIFQNFINKRLPYNYKIPLYVLRSIIIVVSFSGIYDLIYNFNLMFSDYKFYMLSFSLITLSIVINYSEKYIFKNSNLISSRIGKFSISLNDKGIIRTGEFFKSELKWNSFKFYVKNNDYLYLMLSDFEGIIIPLKDLPLELIANFERTIKDCFA
ncbi:YcxB family protein [Leptospira terpstrae]|uniref:YcxB family protein n=2 Tax=Leptospira terpstrae TaxID=293075 RepID=UPI003CFD26D7